MAESYRQLVAIMFTDIVGYTRLMGEDEAKALRLLEENRSIQRELAQKFNGKFLKEIGDGTLLSFSSAIEAVRCAKEIQARSRGNSLNGLIRIGIHLGDVTTDNEDVFGEGVNIASRLQDLSDPGGIYISEDIQRLIRSHNDIDCKYLGEVPLKNVKDPVRTYAIQGEGYPAPKLKIKKGPGRNTKIAAGLLFLLLTVMSIWVVNTLSSEGKEIRSVAVLPFDNLSGDPDQNYFAEGMTHTLVANLGKVSALKVIMYQSTIQFIGTNQSISQIGRQLGVDAIVTGSVIREGTAVRVNAQMVDVETEEILWVDTYDRDIISILKLHSEVAQAIVNEIQILVTPDEIELLKDAPEVDPDVYETVLKGLYHLYRITVEDYDLAFDYFTEAVRMDTTSAQAYAGLALLWVHRGQWASEAPLVAAERARRNAVRALELDPVLPMAHLAMAHVYTSFEWKWDEAVSEYKKILQLNPSLSEPRIFYGDLLVSLHEDEEAISQARKAIELDPFNGIVHSVSGWVFFATRNYDEGIVHFNKSFETVPEISLSHRCLWTTYHIRGQYELAIKHAIRFYRAQGIEETALDLEEKYAELGYAETLRFAADHLAEITKVRYVSAMRVARLYTFCGDKELALDYLEKAYDEHYVSFFSLNVDPHWESLHDEPRFQALLEKVNLTLKE